ncbi:hypothetical protein M231_02678 [Tremella mesenterica]|uniref:Mutanase n=1 Tax=Tremella mesenterica TaxID=5217 RepID=A0A4Q1BQ38_TREME|nr:hypothetical protein M231_02678 [Tremella mesenterica]
MPSIFTLRGVILTLLSLSTLEALAESPHSPADRRSRHRKRCPANDLAILPSSSSSSSSSLSSTSPPPTIPAVLNAAAVVQVASDLTLTTVIGGTTWYAPMTAASSSTSSISQNPGTPSSSSASAPAAVSSISSGGGGSNGGGGNDLPGKYVFAHFMVGIVSTYQLQDWVNDMKLAFSYGISGFALNIGVDPYTDAQLTLAYQAAQQVPGFWLFISFDFNWYQIGQVSDVATKLKTYGSQSSQLKVDGKVFVSTFIGDGFDWGSVASQSGMELEVVPFWQPTADNANNGALGGLFSWDAWPGQLNNQPVLSNMTTDRDELYLSLLDPLNKPYMMPVSPWFSTHFGKEVSYSKNWVFYSETLWVDRWNQVMQLSNQVNFLEIVTWNDYGESHYIGPYDTPHTDDGSSKWASGLDHSPMMVLAKPYISAFKQGANSPVVDEEAVVFWYRPHMKSAQCDSSDNCGSKPTGWDFVSDAVFVATMTKSGGTVTVNSGGSSSTHTVSAGVQVFQVPMNIGSQQISIQTSSGASGSGTGNITVSGDCWGGIYNYNFHSEAILL